MEKPVNPIVNIADVKLDEMGHGDKFLVRRARVAPSLGLQNIGCSVQVIPPGKRAYPFHKHHVLDELFYVVSGTGEYRFGEEKHPVKAGDLVGAPAGSEGHQLINTGLEDLRCLAMSSGGGADIVEYPDSGKIGVAAGIKNGDFRSATIAGMGRLQKADYWEGED
jgi:uncharacterized cupin superfamily protein